MPFSHWPGLSHMSTRSSQGLGMGEGECPKGKSRWVVGQQTQHMSPGPFQFYGTMSWEGSERWAKTPQVPDFGGGGEMAFGFPGHWLRQVSLCPLTVWPAPARASSQGATATLCRGTTGKAGTSPTVQGTS